MIENNHESEYDITELLNEIKTLRKTIAELEKDRDYYMHKCEELLGAQIHNSY